MYNMGMSKDYEIIELFKKIKHINNDNQAAIKLGVTKAYIYNIKSEKIKLSEKTTIKMAKLAGLPIVEAWLKRCEKRIIDNL